MFFKKTVRARVTNLPKCTEITKKSVSALRSSDINRLVSVSGTVIRTGAIKMLEYEREFVCTRCKHKFIVQADMEQYNVIVKPSICPSNKDCTSTSFKYGSHLYSQNAENCANRKPAVIIKKSKYRTRFHIYNWVPFQDLLLLFCKTI